MADDDDDDLKLNSLHRFAKKSPRLALEEYSHCEVPAGCGGVVMRWTDLAEGVPAILRVVVQGAVTAFLDGEPLASGRATLSYGDHLLAIAIERGPAPVAAPQPSGARGALRAIQDALVPPRPPVTDGRDLFAAAVAPDRGRVDPYERPIAATGDGTWAALAADEAPEGWRDASFAVDAPWTALAEAPPGAVAALPEAGHDRWRFEELERIGARALLLPSHARIWIRKRLTVVRR